MPSWIEYLHSKINTSRNPDHQSWIGKLVKNKRIHAHAHCIEIILAVIRAHQEALRIFHQDTLIGSASDAPRDKLEAIMNYSRDIIYAAESEYAKLQINSARIICQVQSKQTMQLVLDAFMKEINTLHMTSQMSGEEFEHYEHVVLQQRYSLAHTLPKVTGVITGDNILSFYLDKYFRPDIVDQPTTALALKWKNVGPEKPKRGKEIKNEELAKALQQRMHFSQQEMDNFKVGGISYQDFIRVEDKYFRQDFGEQEISRTLHVANTLILQQSPDHPADSLYFIHAGIAHMYMDSNVSLGAEEAGAAAETGADESEDSDERLAFDLRALSPQEKDESIDEYEIEADDKKRMDDAFETNTHAKFVRKLPRVQSVSLLAGSMFNDVEFLLAEAGFIPTNYGHLIAVSHVRLVRLKFEFLRQQQQYFSILETLWSYSGDAVCKRLNIEPPEGWNWKDVKLHRFDTGVEVNVKNSVLIVKGKLGRKLRGLQQKPITFAHPPADKDNTYRVITSCWLLCDHKDGVVTLDEPTLDATSRPLFRRLSTFGPIPLQGPESLQAVQKRPSEATLIAAGQDVTTQESGGGVAAHASSPTRSSAAQNSNEAACQARQVM